MAVPGMIVTVTSISLVVDQGKWPMGMARPCPTRDGWPNKETPLTSERKSPDRSCVAEFLSLFFILPLLLPSSCPPFHWHPRISSPTVANDDLIAACVQFQ